MLMFTKSGFPRPPAVRQRGSLERVVANPFRAIPLKHGVRKRIVPTKKAVSFAISPAKAEVGGVEAGTLLVETLEDVGRNVFP